MTAARRPSFEHLERARDSLAAASSPMEMLEACEALTAAARALETEQRNAIAAAAAKAIGEPRLTSYTPYAHKPVEAARKGHQLFIGEELHTVTGKPVCSDRRVVLTLKRGGPISSSGSDVRLSFPIGARLTFVAGVRINGVWQG